DLADNLGFTYGNRLSNLPASGLGAGAGYNYIGQPQPTAPSRLVPGLNPGMTGIDPTINPTLEYLLKAAEECSAPETCLEPRQRRANGATSAACLRSRATYRGRD